MGIMETEMESRPPLKPLHWVGSSKRDLLSLPGPVVDLFGFALYLAQDGKKHEQAKPLRGFGSAGVLEVVEDWDRSTYRAVYTVRFDRYSCCMSFRRSPNAARPRPKPISS